MNMVWNQQPLFVYERLSEPLLRFSFRRRYVEPRKGLREAGPYDANQRSHDIISIGLISERRIMDISEKFIEKLDKGENYYVGFRSIFKVNDFRLEDKKNIEIDNDMSNEEIFQAIKEAYFEIASKLLDKSVVIVALNDHIVDKMYWSIKSLKFMNTGKTVRVQVIRESTLKKAFSNSMIMDFTLFNVSTAIYTKAAGTPWILDRELIPAGIFIGIAFTKPKISSDNISNRKELFYYGIFTVYNKYGKYVDMTVHGITIEKEMLRRIRGTKGLYVPRRIMESVLRQIINRYSPPVVIIHKSARFHRDEIEAVQSIFGSKGIDYAMVHIESSNPYRGFGIGNYNKAPVRGDLIIDTENNGRAIFFTTGCVQGDSGLKPRNRPGTPKPIEIEIQENTTPYDPKAFAYQILALTKLDWNTTDIEIRIPITIKYARRASSLMPIIKVEVTDIRDLM